jgi:tungstate transport system ATP-binding protein
MTPQFELQQITLCYGTRTVLRIPHFVVNRGETWALIGPSGAGKSTLLRVLCLLESPTTGHVRYASQLLNGTIPLHIQRQIALVFQRPLLLDTTVWHNVAYGLKLRGQRDDQRVRVKAMLQQLGLEHLAQARATTLSGGEMQRVAVARALVLRPHVLLLDEPTANLDPQNVALIEQAVAALHHGHGTTVVLATHNLHQARRLARHTVMLLDGALVETGTTEHVLDQPCEARTRAFVRGDMVY